MKPQSAESSDPFDLDFEADDDFSGPPAATAGEPQHDPIPGPPVAGPAPDPFEGLSTPETASAPPQDGAPAATTGNPIAEMIASAEAALGEHTVPRITIHAFCARAETGEMVEKAAGDRRMERAKTVVHQGGLAAAVDFYQNQPTPSLLLLESQDPAAQLLDLLGRLAEVCDPGTKVVLIGAANDISLYRELMRRGVSEYLVPPLSALQLIAAITALYADPAQPFIGRQIAFCGARGGAGASTLAHNVAHRISEIMGANTVLVDLDLAFGTAGLDFNQDPLHGVADALTQPDRLDPVLMERMMARCSDHLSLFAAPASLEKDFEIAPETYEDVANKIRASTPYVVLDLPHAWTSWTRRLLITSDDLVIVAEPELTSLRNAKNIIDRIRSARPNDSAPRVVLNKVGLPGRPEIPVKDFGEALGLTPAMVIPFDAKLFGQAANNGQMLAEVSPKSKQAENLDQLARMISRRDAPAEAPPKARSLFDLFRR
ncbi:MAG: CpaE family protein [Caulobacteraceae bacterium]|nr:CpaE family protein [Caulobacteraceae bacterium]